MLRFGSDYCSFFQEIKSYGVKKPFASVLCLPVAEHHVANNLLSLHLLDGLKTSQVGRMSRRTETELRRVVKDKPGKGSFGSSRDKR